VWRAHASLAVPALRVAHHRGRVWEPFEGSNVSRVGSRTAVPAAHHRGRVWEPFEGSHVNTLVYWTVRPRKQKSKGVGTVALQGTMS
jgi:hypothetical protein